LNCVKRKVSADTDGDARETGQQEYAHDQSSASVIVFISQAYRILLRCRRRRLLLQCAGADSYEFAGGGRGINLLFDRNQSDAGGFDLDFSNSSRKLDQIIAAPRMC
jgi:hypothetical protein